MSREDINRQAFQEEAEDLLGELESALLELEGQTDDHDLIDRVFRAMHTIKGSGAMFGFDDVASFTHDVETVFDQVRNGHLEVTRELLDLTLAARDHIAYLLHSSESGEEVDLEKGQDITTALRALLPSDLQTTPQAASKDAQEEDEEAEIAIWRIRFKPHADYFLFGNNPLNILEELNDLGTSSSYPHFEDVPSLEAINSESCHVWWDILLSTRKSEQDIRDVFLFVEEECDVQLHVVDRGQGIEEEGDYKKLGEILVERGDISAEDLRAVLEERQRLGNILTKSGVVTPEKVESALQEQRAVRQVREQRAVKVKAPQEPQVSSIRVGADKLDYLVDLVGELVIVQAQITQSVSRFHDTQLTVLAEELERLSDELRDSTLNIRMLPIGTTFSKFRRLVRDLSAELGKEIELQTKGAETELDKTVIERLNDPLVHLLRNSIDHGIETPDKRKEAGKEPAGKILLVAEHSGGEVIIQIIDDGKGIDEEVVRRKAIERGLLTADQEVSKQELLMQIFMPGFSTAEKVTNVSGRGVGMDVVKRGIDELRGAVSIQSDVGQGTTITIKLPLTLAIIDGLQVVVGDEYYVMPLSLVEECVELVRGELHASSKEQIVNLRGEIVPYVRLSEWFEVPGERPAIEQIVVVHIGEERVGIVVDNVIGEHQTVIKSLGKLYKNVPGISGATIKGDGTMALILDIPQLISIVSGK